MTAAIKAPRRSYKGKFDSVTEVIEKNLAWGVDGIKRFCAQVAADHTARFIAEGGAYDESARRGVNMIYKVREDYADAGTAAHAMIEAYLEGNDPDDAVDAFLDSEVLSRAQRCFEKFVEWWATAGYAVVDTEKPLIDPAGDFAGTRDLLLRAPDGALVVADIKTGKKVRPEVVLQLGALARLGQLHGEAVQRGLVIHCPVEGDVAAHPVTAAHLDLGANMFGSLLIIHKLKKLLPSFEKAA